MSNALSQSKRDRFVHIGRLTMAAKNRKTGIVEAYMKVGKTVTLRGQPFVQLSDENYQAIRKEFQMAQPVSKRMECGSPPLSPAAPVPKRTIPPFNPRRKTLPGLATMAKNAASATARVIAAAATGQPIQANEPEYQRRMSICTACEFLDKTTQRCVKCGCFIAAQVIGKAHLATETCPIGKWDKKEL